MKRCSKPLIIRRMQSKTLKYHFTPIRMAFVNKIKHNKCCQEMEKLEHLSTVGSNIIWYSCYGKNSTVVPEKIKNGITI